jgi:hypothetical protein
MDECTLKLHFDKLWGVIDLSASVVAVPEVVEIDNVKSFMDSEGSGGAGRGGGGNVGRLLIVDITAVSSLELLGY